MVITTELWDLTEELGGYVLQLMREYLPYHTCNTSYSAEQFLANWLKANNEVFLVYKDTGEGVELERELVGFVMTALNMDECGEKVCTITHMYIQPEHRKFGTASKVVDQIEELCIKQNVRYVTFMTSFGNKPCLALARAKGYKPHKFVGVKELIGNEDAADTSSTS